jgi:ribosomal protein S11
MSHTTKCKNNTVFIHNSDMSGDVTIVTGKGELDVNGRDIIEFVLQRIPENKLEDFKDKMVGEMMSWFTK